MDTKRNTSAEFLKQAGEKVKAVIEAFKPDVVIAADDNSSKTVIVPFCKDSNPPFVFCGLNWDAGRYGFPTKNITGMVEVAPVKELLEHLKPYAKGNRLGVIGADVETNHTETDASKKILGLQFEAYYSKDVADFKKGFLELQGKVDMLLIDSDGGLYNSAADDLKAFFLANTKVPTGTCYDFMTPYAFLGFAKLAERAGHVECWCGIEDPGRDCSFRDSHCKKQRRGFDREHQDQKGPGGADPLYHDPVSGPGH
jgi:hypothetical protein